MKNNNVMIVRFFLKKRVLNHAHFVKKNRQREWKKNESFVKVIKTFIVKVIRTYIVKVLFKKELLNLYCMHGICLYTFVSGKNS